MHVVVANSGLASWGQAAAIILALSLFLSLILSLALAFALMFGLAWVREKAELIKNLRPFVNELNRALSASKRGDPLPQEAADNKIIHTATQVLPRITGGLPATVSAIGQKVEHGSDRVADAVIEFRARTAMVKGIAKALFLPGASRPAMSVKQAPVLEPESAPVGPEVVGEPPVYEEEIIIGQAAR